MTTSGTNETVKQLDFIVFDLETTGLHPVGAHIVEIGAVRFGGDGAVRDQFQQLVDPQCAIPPRVTEIHGITNQMVSGQPCIGDVLPRFTQFLGDKSVILLAHNAAFDVGFLSVAFSRIGQASPAHPVIDTCALARRRLSLPNYKLETIGRHLRLIDAEKHRALDDALLLKDVFVHLITKSPAIGGVDELYRLSPTLSFDQFAVVLDYPPPGYEELWEAISEQQPVEMEYVGGSMSGATRVVTPLGAMELRGRAYLSAFCHNSECDKTFRLDRISSYRKVD